MELFFLISLYFRRKVFIKNSFVEQLSILHQAPSICALNYFIFNPLSPHLYLLLQLWNLSTQLEHLSKHSLQTNEPVLSKSRENFEFNYFFTKDTRQPRHQQIGDRWGEKVRMASYYSLCFLLSTWWYDMDICSLILFKMSIFVSCLKSRVPSFLIFIWIKVKFPSFDYANGCDWLCWPFWLPSFFTMWSLPDKLSSQRVSAVNSIWLQFKVRRVKSGNWKTVTLTTKQKKLNSPCTCYLSVSWKSNSSNDTDSKLIDVHPLANDGEQRNGRTGNPRSGTTEPSYPSPQNKS